MAEGAKLIDDMLEAGFSHEEADAFMREESTAMQTAGFNNEEIMAYWGQEEPDDSSFIRYAEDMVDGFLDETIGADVEGKRPDVLKTARDAYVAGAQSSVAGLLYRGKAPDTEVPPSLLGTSIAGITAVAADLPIMIGAGIFGAAAGAAGGPAAPITVPAGAGFAALAVPTVLREALLDGYRNGSIKDPIDYLQRTARIYFEAAKQGAVGASAATAGSLAKPGIDRLAKEIIAFTVVGQGVEGNIPTARDFVETAAVIGGLKGAIKLSVKGVNIEDARRLGNQQQRIQTKLENIYAKTGKQPQQLVADSFENPTIMEDLLSKNVDIPRAYRSQDPNPARHPETLHVQTDGPVGKAKGKGTIVDGRLPPDVVEAFESLGEQQRGTPEMAMTTYQGVNPGMQGYLMEHAGDLTHRMSHMAKHGYDGRIEVGEKVPKLLRNLKRESLRDSEGGDTVEASLRVNAETRGGDAEVLAKEESAARSKYVAAHKKLPVYNEAQYSAREAAIAIGERRYEDAEFHLGALNKIVGDAGYAERVFEYERDGRGGLVQWLPPEITKVETAKPVESSEGKTPPPPTPTPETRGPPPPEPPKPFDLKSAEGRILDKLSVGTIGGGLDVALTMHKIYEEAFDSLHPLNRLVKLLADNKELPAGADPLKLARTNLGSAMKANGHFQIEQRSFFGEVVGPSLNEILKPLGNRRQKISEFRAYIAARRANELHQRGITSGLEKKDALAVEKAGHKEFGGMFEKVLTYQNNLLQHLIDVELLSVETGKKIRAANADYVPWYRVMDETIPQHLGRGLKARQPVKKIEGSERDIIDPLESIVKNTYAFVQLAERNFIMKALVELGESNPAVMEGVMREVAPDLKTTKVTAKELEPLVKSIKEEFGIEFTPEELQIFRTSQRQPNDATQIAFYRKGVREIWELPPDVARVFNGLDKESASIFVKMMSVPAKMLRAGAILTPEFTGRNILRDTVFAGVTSRSGFVPGVDTIIGLSMLMTKGQVYRDWLAQGGAQATVVSLDRQYIANGLSDILKRTGARSNLRNLIMDESRPANTEHILNPATLLEGLRTLSELGENATRVGEARRAQLQLRKRAKKGKGPHQTEFDIQKEAAFRGREVTDFARMGAKMRSANMMIAFLNARLQGEDRMVRSFVTQPAKATFMATATITLPTVLLWLAQKDDPTYKAVSTLKKRLTWPIVIDSETVVLIPKPHTLGWIFGTLPEMVLEKYVEDHDEVFEGLGRDFLTSNLSSVIPQAISPPLEAAINYSLHRDRPLVGGGPGSFPLPQDRYTEYTTELAKAISKGLTGLPGQTYNDFLSPIVIENFVRQWTGGLGAHTLALVDKALRDGGHIPDPIKPDVPLSQQPFIRAFVARFPSASTAHMEEFYNRLDRHTQAHNSFQKAKKAGNLHAMQAVLSIDNSAMLDLDKLSQIIANMRKINIDVQNSQMFSSAELRGILDDNYMRMTSVAILGNQKMDMLEESLGELDINLATEPAPSEPTSAPSFPFQQLPPVQKRSLPGKTVVPITKGTPDVAIPTEPTTPSPLPEISTSPTHKIKQEFARHNVRSDETLEATDLLINAQIHQESRGKANAISPAGAIGLMQILPSTAMAPGFGVPPIPGTRSQVSDKLRDPQTNLRFGRTYLDALLFQYGGNTFYALLAYHSGAGFVDKWIAEGADPNKMGTEGGKYVRLVSEHLSKKIPNYVKRTKGTGR